MLNPADRRTLLEALRPPLNYALSDAVGTTYTLDLITLLTTPLAFTLFEHEDDPTDADPLALLEALRRHADQISIFCQAGRIQVPERHQPLFGLLESSVHPVTARNQNGVFHPKVWLLRFSPAEGTTGKVKYRLLCSSRNLTFDRSWDTLLVLEGELQERTYAYSLNHPLGDFVKTLPTLCTSPAPAALETRIERLQDEVRRVDWELPDHCEKVRFWPIGIGANDNPFELNAWTMLVVSPFVTGSQLERLPGKKNILVSRLHEIDRVGAPTNFSEIYTLHDRAEPDHEDAAVEELRGLHAKLFVADQGWDAHVWTGSANATHNAFHANVEFLVQLSGKKSKLGIEQILGDEGTLRAMLEPYEHPTDPNDMEEDEDASSDLDRARHLLATAEVHASASADSHSTFHLTLQVPAELTTELTDLGVQVSVWPISLPRERRQPLDASTGGRVTFPQLSLTNLTAFFGIELRAGGDRATFALRASLSGVPEDRKDRIIAELLSDEDRVLRLILMLLADPNDPSSDALDLLRLFEERTRGGEARNGTANLPLVETLLRTLRRAPENLDPVAHLIHDLQKNNPDVLPGNLMRVWSSIWQVRQQERDRESTP